MRGAWGAHARRVIAPYCMRGLPPRLTLRGRQRSAKFGGSALQLGVGLKPRVRRSSAAALVMFAMAAAAGEPAKKPPVPPGVDPGGVAVAIVGLGVDYTKLEIAKRLARDGEGEIIGWDFVDGDRRPYAVGASEAERAVLQRFVPPLLEPQVPSRLAVFRANSRDRVSVAQTLSFVSKSPARIVLLPGGFPESPGPDFEFLAAVSKQFPELLVIVPAGDQGAELDAAWRETLANVVVVSASASGYAATTNRGKMVDVAAAGDLKWGYCDQSSCVTAGGAYSQIAAARVAALAARVSAENAALGGASLKDAIVALAKPDATVKTRYGVIEKTGPDFRTK